MLSLEDDAWVSGMRFEFVDFHRVIPHRPKNCDHERRPDTNSQHKLDYLVGHPIRRVHHLISD